MVETRLKPLMVKGLARSGSTFLMNCLSQLDGIAVALQQPCEVRYAQYLASVCELLTAPADLENSARPNFFHPDKRKNWIGRNPFNRRLKKGYAKYFDNDYDDSFRTFFMNKTDSFYRRVAAINGVNPKFLCEKALYITQGKLEQDPDVIHQLYRDDVSAIYLARDPRDVICSNRAFFHAGEDTDNKMWIRAIERLGTHADAMARAFRGNRRESRLVVRYEELMHEPAESLSGIAEWLELEPNPGDLDAAIAFAAKSGPRKHKTSGSPSASIGRWQGELTDELICHSDHCFEKYRRTFGYD